MTYFEIAILTLLAIQTFLLFAVLRVMFSVRRDLSFQLKILDRSIDLLRNDNADRLAGISNGIDALNNGLYALRPPKREILP
jgi:hypothetical protein